MAAEAAPPAGPGPGAAGFCWGAAAATAVDRVSSSEMQAAAGEGGLEGQGRVRGAPGAEQLGVSHTVGNPPMPGIMHLVTGCVPSCQLLHANIRTYMYIHCKQTSRCPPSPMVYLQPASSGRQLHQRRCRGGAPLPCPHRWPACCTHRFSRRTGVHVMLRCTLGKCAPEQAACNRRPQQSLQRHGSALAAVPLATLQCNPPI